MSVEASTAVGMFDRVVCGVDGAAESFEAARQAEGVDGSPQSLVAAAVAKSIAERFGSGVSGRHGDSGRDVDLDPLHAFLPDFVTDSRPAVDALVDLSEEADLLVVGSRGLHGPKALGSVSERVGHRAACSVLVVRNP